MKFNLPAFTIERIAADVFWTYVFENGFRDTIATITDNVPSAMWSYERAEKEIGNYFNYDLDVEVTGADSEIIKDNLVNTIYEAVLSVILQHTREERNIVGPIFVEDFKDCKEENFKYRHLLEKLDQDSDEECSYEIKTKGDFVHTGTLLLRTPLPSGILLKGNRYLFQNPIIVKNTKKALGFHKTLIFSPDGLAKLPPNPQQYTYFLPGIFHIPIEADIDSTWLKVVPNAIAIRKSGEIYAPNGVSSFSIQRKSESGIWHQFINKLGWT